MEQNASLGKNRTGIDMSPVMSKEMIEGAEKLMNRSAADAQVRMDDPAVSNGQSSITSFDKIFMENAGPLGTVPLPGTLKGAVKSTMKMLSGRHPEVFINKLGERLAYERSGVRTYEQLINKLEFGDTAGKSAVSIPLDMVAEFRDQEAEHFQMLVDAMRKLGADPTAQTPDADASGVAAMGLMKVIMDPRTSVSQSLEAMLAIELTDNAAWELLIELASDMGQEDMVEDFQRAFSQEKVHLDQIQQWYRESVRSQLQ